MCLEYPNMGITTLVDRVIRPEHESTLAFGLLATCQVYWMLYRHSSERVSFTNKKKTEQQNGKKNHGIDDRFAWTNDSNLLHIRNQQQQQQR